MKAANSDLCARRCAECGKAMPHAHKVRPAGAICQTCYQRLFKRRQCSQCGGGVRALPQDSAPICPACQRATRTCARCDRPVPRAALIRNGEAVCPSCATYFREARPCSRCGTASTRLSRVVGMTDAPVCDRCRRALLCATCSACGKHRQRYAVTAEGKPLCKSCAEAPEATHACPDCSRTVGGGGLHPCLTCGMARSLRKKAMALNALLQRDDLRTLLQQFVEWIIAAGAINKVLGRLPRIAETLSRIEAAMSQGDSLPQALNSQPVTTEEIRRLGLFAAFLVEIGVLTQTNRARAEVSEHRRIRQMLSQIGAKPWCASVRDYATEIADPAVKLSLRTQRVYLRAAIELMDFSQVERISELTNAQVRSFLRKRPGHRASLARWVSRVRRVTGHPLGLPARAGQRSRAVAAIASDVRVLDGAIEATTSRRAQRALLAQLLATLYGVPLEHVLSLDRDCLAVSPGRVRLQVGEEWITIASPVDRLVATVLADAADPRRSAMLFPGRLPDDGLSTTAVRYHVRQALDKN